MFSKKCSIAACVAIAIAVMFLAGSMAANAGIIASQDFTGTTTLAQSNIGYDVGTSVPSLDQTADEIDVTKAFGSIQTGQWEFDSGGENIIADLDNGSLYTVSFDARVNSLGASAETNILLGLGDTNSNRKMVKLTWDGVQSASTFDMDVRNETTAHITTGTVGVYDHYDIVVNRGGALADYNGLQDLAADHADIWINGALAFEALDLNGDSFGTQDVENMKFRSGGNRSSDMSFDNLEIRNEAFVVVPEPATMSMLLMAIGGLALLLRRRR